MLRFFCVFAVVFLSGTQLGFAQDIQLYRSLAGHIVINGVFNDSALVARSKKLTILLDYETADIMITLDKSTLVTGIDSLDKKLAMLEKDYIEFDGKLGIEYINTKSHPPQEFEIEGYFNPRANNKLIKGHGRLEHLWSSGEYSCLLGLTFYLKLSELGLEMNLPYLHDEIHIEIIQTVLRKLSDF